MADLTILGVYFASMAATVIMAFFIGGAVIIGVREGVPWVYRKLSCYRRSRRKK